MARRLQLYVVLGSALTFLASLYLTWEGAAIGGPQGPFDLSSDISYAGWGPFGQAAALFALALVAGAGVTLLRPELETRLPLATCGAALLYFAVLNAAELRAFGIFRGAFDRLPVHLGAGAYMGIASAAVACLAAAAGRWNELARPPSPTAGVAAGLTLGLLAAFLLPYLHVRVPHIDAGAATGYQLSGLGNNAIVFIAASAIFGLLLWRRRTPPGGRLAAALGIAVLVGGSLSPLGTRVHWPYETWLELGCALGLVVLALATARGVRISWPEAAEAAAVVAAALLILSLFLPWGRFCGGGACESSSGWTQVDSVTAGGLALILAVVLLARRRFVVELAVGAAIYVAATGAQLTQFNRLEYGAPLGFVGAALLLVAAAPQLRTVPADWKRLVPRLVPIAACLAFIAIPIAALTSNPPSPLVFDSPWRVFWLEVAAILIVLRLLGRWLAGPRDDNELVFLPSVLLVLTALDLIFIRGQGVSWEGWASVVLSAVLVALGWIERKGGLERLRIPDEIWRVDRLPGEN